MRTRRAREGRESVVIIYIALPDIRLHRMSVLATIVALTAPFDMSA